MGIKEALGLGSGKKVRYAIVGVDDIAQEDMMPSVGHTGNSTMTALVTSDPKKAQEFGEKYGGENLTVASEQIKGEVWGCFPRPSSTFAGAAVASIFARTATPKTGIKEPSA